MTTDQAPVRLQANMPKDGNAVSMQLTPGTLALAVTNTSVATHSEITLQTASATTGLPATSLLEVSAITNGICLRWTSTATTSAFDEFIQAGTTRHYRVPVGVLVVSLVAQTGSATAIVIEK